MAETFYFELVSPERRLVSSDFAEVVIPGQEGDLAALPNHALMVVQLRPGILTTKTTAGEEKQYFLRGGFADIGPGETAVIAEYAVPLQDFSAALLTDEIALAEQAIEDARDDVGRFAASDRLERLHSLKARLGI
ncbi:MAG: ATP synthase F1 subunit epsilon [Rhodomicrobium sp.]